MALLPRYGHAFAYNPAYDAHTSSLWAYRWGQDVGRKLNPIEAASSFSDACAEPSSILPSRSQLLQQRIAEQLGVSADEFRKTPQPASVVQKNGTLFGPSDATLSRECLELLDAYIRILDPEQRRRCLQAVREAAYSSPDPGSKAKA